MIEAGGKRHLINSEICLKIMQEVNGWRWHGLELQASTHCSRHQYFCFVNILLNPYKLKY